MASMKQLVEKSNKWDKDCSLKINAIAKLKFMLETVVRSDNSKEMYISEVCENSRAPQYSEEWDKIKIMQVMPNGKQNMQTTMQFSYM